MISPVVPPRYAFGFVRVGLLFVRCCAPAVAFGQPETDKPAVGVELDILPYLTGGYFGAVWIGKDHLRVRALTAKVHMPDFIVPDGFTNNEITSYALVGDYFLNGEQRGWWGSGGLVLWKGRIQSDARVETVDYDSYLVNASLGYAHFLTAHLYVSPWTGLSVRVGGDSHVVVDGFRYEAPVLNPEVSLKAGWRF